MAIDKGGYAGCSSPADTHGGTPPWGVPHFLTSSLHHLLVQPHEMAHHLRGATKMIQMGRIAYRLELVGMEYIQRRLLLTPRAH